MYLLEDNQEVLNEPSNEVVDEKPSKTEKEYKEPSSVKLKLIFFFISLALTVAVIVLGVFSVTGGFEIIGFNPGPLDIITQIQTLVDVFTGEPTAYEIIDNVYLTIFMVYQIVLLIILVVYAIVLFIKTIVMITKKRDADKMLNSFRRIERNFAAPFAMFLIFNTFLLVSNGEVNFLYYVEVALLSLLVIGNSLFKAFLDESKSESFKLSRFIYALIEMVCVYGILFLLFFGLSKEPFFFKYFYGSAETLLVGGEEPDINFYMTVGAVVVKLSGFFVALSICRRIFAYYPFDDKKDVDDGVAYSLNGTLVKSIIAFILITMANVVFYIAEANGYSEISDVIVKGPLYVGIVLVMTIGLKITHGIFYKKMKEKKQ